ncbi:nitroreductase family protein [Pedobacter insulae]|uniref:Nitroreductase n=1 Tax=Pedobacter insulae TaxID=414048 RepID=A0A1I2UK53_9SPHI|nr:nitroreductase [Pedobacter insulae]SFG76017.1 Nitroreductase [Pedobacter insulae]
MNSNFETLTKIIKNRRSIFPASYIEKEIPVSLIEQVLESANYAPTHKLTQPWRFVVIRKEAKTKLGKVLAQLYQEKVEPTKFLQKKYESFPQKTSQADCILAINIKFHPDQVPAWEEIAAVACAVQNVALTAESLNIGAYWSSPPLIDDLGQFLNLGENEKCFGLFYMGYHNEKPRKANRTSMADKVIWMDQ